MLVLSFGLLAHTSNHGETMNGNKIAGGHQGNNIIHWNMKMNGLNPTNADRFWEPTIIGGYNLPLMVINTNGQDILNEPRIVADMGLIFNGKGNLNSESDEWNEYSGKISIEKRGESSMGFKKKSYSIELQKEDGSNNNVSILGLPAENDFVLYGPYSDKTMIKNVLTYELFRRTGRWAPRTRYIELILNNDYRGVYVLTEKLKRDENRVDIDKLTIDDILPVDITGGYILRRDKKKNLTFDEYWTSPVDQPYHEQMWYEYYDPKYDELTYEQTEYINQWMEEFDYVMSGDDFAHPENGYKKYIRTKSFIDMMFINEISKGIDNYMFSTYFFKENDEDGGQLNAGPPWDYNVGYGNVNYGEDWNAAETYGWGYPQGSRTYWFERLMEDPVYQNKVFCRWTQFRDSLYSDESVIAIIDSCVTVLGDAVDRNFDKYPILGEYFWPANYWPDTYEEEIDYLKSWLVDRLQWMDDEWYNMGDNCTEEVKTEISSLQNIPQVVVFPNPSNFQEINFQVNLKEPAKELIITVYNLQGELVKQKSFSSLSAGLNNIQLNNLSHLMAGIYIYKIHTLQGIIYTGKINKF